MQDIYYEIYKILLGDRKYLSEGGGVGLDHVYEWETHC